MPYLFTSESVSEGHPDKIADQISDALVDHFLAFDPSSKVACETLVTTGQVVLAGEVKSKTYLDVQEISREVIRKIGYTKSEYMFEANSCGIFSAIHEQSPDINQGVERQNKEEQGAGDQGMMFGYATAETENYMPLALDLSHKVLQELSTIRREGKVMKYLRPDAKSQVTIEYSDDNKPVLRKLFNDKITYHINPTGKFVIGGPHGDTGLTGRKIIVDTYGGKGAHGGGAFSGKDPSKVDRSAAYATRHIAKNLVAAGVCDEVLVQVSYAIGVAKPTSIYINTYGSAKVKKTDGQIANIIQGMEMFDMRPYSIEKRFKLRTPIYSEAAAYGHMGRTPEKKKLTFKDGSGKVKVISVETFPWEKLDAVKEVKKAFNL